MYKFTVQISPWIQWTVQFKTLVLDRAGYREKFQNRYTYVQELTVTDKYRYFLLSLLMGSVYSRFLNFHDLGMSDVRGV